MNVRIGIAVWLVVALTATACGGADTDRASLAGVYEHPEEGRLTLSADATATLDQSGQITALEWTLSGSAITFTFDDVIQEAALRDGDIVFPPGAFSGDEETVFERRGALDNPDDVDAGPGAPTDPGITASPAPTPQSTEAVTPAPPDPLTLIERGDCVSLSGERIAEVVCDDKAAEAEVLRVVNQPEPDCPDRATITHTVEVTEADGTSVTYAFCLRRILPANADGVLTVGSCVQREQKTETTSDITELPCRQRKKVTHRVIASVRKARNCPDRTDVSISKTKKERRQSGGGVWCLAER